MNFLPLPKFQRLTALSNRSRIRRNIIRNKPFHDDILSSFPQFLSIQLDLANILGSSLFLSNFILTWTSRWLSFFIFWDCLRFTTFVLSSFLSRLRLSLLWNRFRSVFFCTLFLFLLNFFRRRRRNFIRIICNPNGLLNL